MCQAGGARAGLPEDDSFEAALSLELNAIREAESTIQAEASANASSASMSNRTQSHCHRASGRPCGP